VSIRRTFAENEERSPWEPFHVQHGLRPDASAVSVFTGCRSTAFTLGLREKHWREHVRNLLRGMDPYGPPTLLLDPIAARQFVERGGFTKKDALIDWLHDTARLPASEYWDYQLVQNYVYPRATFGEEPWASNLRAAPDELIPMFRREDIHVVVVGGGASAAGDLLLDPAREVVAQRALRPNRDRVRIVPAAFADEAGMFGAGLFALADGEV